MLKTAIDGGLVCPAHAGMSPASYTRFDTLISLPRTRGDEPDDYSELRVTPHVCPAHAGMSPPGEFLAVLLPRLPRTRGDEPC